MPEPDAETFEAHRDLMFAEDRMLGTVADAEDAVQDAWLRWSAALPHPIRAAPAPPGCHSSCSRPYTRSSVHSPLAQVLSRR